MTHEHEIVVLDGYTLNPGDLTWGDLSAMGGITVYDRTDPGEVTTSASQATILLTNKTLVTRETIESLPLLTYIGVLATGYNIVDIDAAARRRIPVTNVPEYGTESVAEMVFALLLELTRGTGAHARSVTKGRWSSSVDFCFILTPQVELAGKTMGIVGYGRIGRATARIARAFGMNVVATDLYQTDEDDVRFLPLDDLFAKSDVVSLHCPLVPETAGFVDAHRLGLMKRGAFLINTSRGPLVNERDLADFLTSGRIAGAGLDVLVKEPPDTGNPLTGAPNCIITPHIAWATLSARKRLMDTATANVRAFLKGSAVNVVNGVTG